MVRKPTEEALRLKLALQKLGIFVEEEVGDGFKHVDLSIPASRIDIEIDGRQHLTNPYQILSDLNRSHYSDVDGYATIHIPNELIRIDLGGIASAIAEASKIKEDKLNLKHL